MKRRVKTKTESTVPTPDSASGFDSRDKDFYSPSSGANDSNRLFNMLGGSGISDSTAASTEVSLDGLATRTQVGISSSRTSSPNETRNSSPSLSQTISPTPSSGLSQTSSSMKLFEVLGSASMQPPTQPSSAPRKISPRRVSPPRNSYSQPQHGGREPERRRNVSEEDEVLLACK